MPRRLSIALLSVWPGLAQIWTGQEVLGLILAAMFAVALNLAILSKFLWTEAFGAGLPEFFAAAAVLTWFAAMGYTLWWLWRCHPDRHRPSLDRLYREAAEHYLRGEWNESRRRIESILTLDETDADALMLLGTLLMRTGQADPARKAFRQCLDLETGSKWKWEIGQMLGRIEAPAVAA